PWGGLPRRPLPAGARRACRRMLHAGRVERRPPAALVVLRQLEVEALTVHPNSDVADAGPGVEPCVERPESPVIRGTGKPGEAEGCSQKLAALIILGGHFRLRPARSCARVWRRLSRALTAVKFSGRVSSKTIWAGLFDWNVTSAMFPPKRNAFLCKSCMSSSLAIPTNTQPRVNSGVLVIRTRATFAFSSSDIGLAQL